MTIVSGAIDVTTYLDYRVFASKQTGNVVFLAVYLFSNKQLGSKIERNVVTSIICFCFGSFAFSRLAHQFRARKRAWLLSSTLFQTILIFFAASVRWLTGSEEVTSTSALVIIALLAFAASGQVSLAVNVGLAEINTTMVTGAMVAILNDPRIFDADNAARNRRLSFVACYAFGCIVGATLTLGSAGTLFLASAVKVIASASFLLNSAKTAARYSDELSSGEESHELVSSVSKPAWGD